MPLTAAADEAVPPLQVGDTVKIEGGLRTGDLGIVWVDDEWYGRSELEFRWR